MVNEEDHLRLQALRSGFALQEAFAAIDKLDRDLGARVPYSFHNEFGFLTACPTNVGTGMRGVGADSSAGARADEGDRKVLAGLQQMGLTYRGLYGEGSEVVGNFFQISNQTTLGRSEEELLDQLLRVVRHVIEREEEARRVLLARCGLYYRGQALARIRHAAIRSQPHVRRGDELPQRRAAGRRAETDHRPQCIYPQQAPDLFASRRTWRSPKGER